jgi:diacylglycerol kinase (ATP)
VIAALIVNTAARSGPEAFAAAVLSFQARDYPLARAEAVEDPATLPALVEEVLADGVDVLVLGGGDGTVSGVAGRLAEAGVTLGLLPIGTANDLARTLGIPVELDAACDTVVSGVVRAVDVGLADHGRAGERAFLNVASVGLAAGVTEALTPELKRRAGTFAYPLAAARAYFSHEPFSARLEFPAGDHHPVELDELLQVAVGNGRYYGGGNVVAPAAGIHDQLLHVYAVPRGTPLQRLQVARDFSTGAFTEQDHVFTLATPVVRLSTDPPLPLNVDGELDGVTPVTFRVARRSLPVLVPG